MMNRVKGNMYEWLTHTWNTVKGKCPHGCHYCYMKRWGEQKPVRFDTKELKVDPGAGNFIFVGSSCDMFASKIPLKWITDTLRHCREFDKNRYLFQSKNPQRIYEMRSYLPEDAVLGTTIESNRLYRQMGNAPNPTDRAEAMFILRNQGYRIMITIEPIMDFDIDDLVSMVIACRPNWINIGANTNHKIKLVEPAPSKVMELIDKLKSINEVKVKPNLRRLMV